jgi:hypothetical protein
MRVVSLLPCVVTLLVLPGPAFGQSAAPVAATPADHVSQSLVEKAIGLFSGPVKILTTSVVPSSGVSGGVELERYQAHAQLMLGGKVSWRGYWRMDAQFSGHPTPNSYVAVYGTWRHMPNLPFYGLGPNSVVPPKTPQFDLEDQTGGGWGWVRFGVLAFAARGEATRATSGRDATEAAAMRASFAPEDLTGFGERLAYWHTAVTADLNYTTPLDLPARGGWYRATLHTYRGIHRAAVSLSLIDVDLRQYYQVPGGIVLGLQADARISPRADIRTAPFFLLPYLGGDTTLEGFADYRFRDSSTALLRIQARRSILTSVPIWKNTSAGPLYVVGFGDAGAVGNGRGALRARAFKGDGGFGVSLWLGAHALLRMDFAFQRREGFQFKPFASNF